MWTDSCLCFASENSGLCLPVQLFPRPRRKRVRLPALCARGRARCVCVCVNLSVWLCLSVCLSLSISVCLSVYLCLLVYLSVCFSPLQQFLFGAFAFVPAVLSYAAALTFGEDTRIFWMGDANAMIANNKLGDSALPQLFSVCQGFVIFMKSACVRWASSLFSVVFFFLKYLINIKFVATI